MCRETYVHQKIADTYDFEASFVSKPVVFTGFFENFQMRYLSIRFCRNRSVFSDMQGQFAKCVSSQPFNTDRTVEAII